MTARVEILRPGGAEIAEGRRVAAHRGRPVVVVHDVDVAAEAVKVGEFWFVKGSPNEARLLDRIVEGAR